MTDAKRMSDVDLIADLRAWAVAKPTFYPVSPELSALCVEAASRLDALRAERIDWARTWKLGSGETEDTFTTPSEWMRRAIKAEAKLATARDGVEKIRNLSTNWSFSPNFPPSLTECCEVAGQILVALTPAPDEK